MLAAALAVPASAAAPRILAAQDVDPVWSPDGTWIAFTRVYADRFVLEAIGSHGRGNAAFEIATNAAKLAPSWAPDRPSLAFSAGGTIYVADVGGRGRTALTQRDEQAYAPAWSPDGARIAYLSTRGGGNTNLWSRVVATGAATELAPDAIGVPAWSPDSTRVAFARDDGVYVTRGDGARRVAVAPTGLGSPTWSPDGRWIAYAAAGRVFAVAADGSAPPHLLASPGGQVGTPGWSPQSDRVVFSDAGGVDVAFLDGRSSRLVSQRGGSVGLAAFSPAGDLLVAFSGPRAVCPGHAAIRVYVSGGSTAITGTCAVVGTRGADVIEGTIEPGDDIVAGAGNDRVHANDGHTDSVDCGAGRDTVWADRRDHLRRCEVVHR